MSELRKEGDKDSIIFFLTNLLYKLIYRYKPGIEDYIFMTDQDELNKILSGVPQATSVLEETAKFLHDSEQNKWRQIAALVNEALLLGKFRGTSPPDISETGFYPLKINSSGELEVSISATSALNINVEDVETLLTDIKAIITYTGDDFETVQDAIRAAVEGIKTAYTFTGDDFETVVDAIRASLANLDYTGDSFETVQDAIRARLTSIDALLSFTGDDFETIQDAIRAQMDKFTFDGSNNLKIVKG